MDDTDVITTAKLEDVFNNIDQNVKYLVEASASNARGAASLNVMQIVLAGSFCFAIIDRISGATFSFNPPNWAYDYIFQPIIDKPGVFFALNIIWLLICSYGLLRFMNYLQDSAMGTLTLRVTINKKLKSKKGMETFFSTKALDNLESEIWVGNPTVRMVEWEETDEEKWLGSAPFIEFAYDATNLFLLSLELSIDKKTSTATEEVLNVPSVRHAVLGFEATHPAVMQLFSCLDDDRKLGLCGLLGDFFFSFCFLVYLTVRILLCSRWSIRCYRTWWRRTPWTARWPLARTCSGRTWLAHSRPKTCSRGARSRRPSAISLASWDRWDKGPVNPNLKADHWRVPPPLGRCARRPSYFVAVGDLECLGGCLYNIFPFAHDLDAPPAALRESFKRSV
mmetsp:Transcript_16802/g.45808  ORF Transcript_16802/g.45808 Transcript_16802/m.45808 type:complete len:394 (+) Transcript_16802:2208-3389(+)